MGDTIRVIDFSQHKDVRGTMCVIENFLDVPFDIERLFYIYNSDPNTIRGQHANRFSEFVLISVAGSCKIRVKDGKDNDHIYVLDSPSKGLYLPAMTWKEMFDFSTDNVLLVLSNAHYNANEYIYDYEAFIEERVLA